MVSRMGSSQPSGEPFNGDEKPLVRPEGPSREFSGNIKVSQKLPTKKDIEKVAELPVLDRTGESRTFKSLHSDPEHPEARTLVIFIRHFFCGNCQEYLRTLCSSITAESLSSLSPPSRIAIIGCGSPELIDFYAEASACHFPIYADPTRKLYEQLKMISTKSLGPKRPDYQQRSILSISLESIFQGLMQGRHALKGGDFWQVGGEFLIENGEVLWCHRMTSTRDHTEVPELRRVLGLDEARIPLRKRWSMGNGGVRRSLSMRSPSWRSRSRGAGRKMSDQQLLEEKVDDEKENLVNHNDTTEVEGAKA